MIKRFNEMSSNMEVSNRLTRVWISDKKFKGIHMKNLGNILHKVYSPIGHWKKKDGGFYGVMNLEWDDEPWSILNRINTNFNALTVMINSINDILDSDIPKFDLTSSEFGSDEFYTEYDRLMDFCKRNAKNIFLKTTEENGSSVINNIVSAIRGTRRVGDKAEEVVTKFLPMLNKNITNIKMPDGSGDSNDMVGGADIFFDYKGKTFTIQVKKVRFINERGDRFITKGASISKHYKTNYYALLDNNVLYFFRNMTSQIDLINGELSIPNTLLVRKFNYKR